jgi:hypothetical protein
MKMISHLHSYLHVSVSKVFDPIVIYEDLRSGTQYWRFQGDFLDRMEVVSGENTEEAIRSKTRY